LQPPCQQQCQSRHCQSQQHRQQQRRQLPKHQQQRAVYKGGLLLLMLAAALSDLTQIKHGSVPGGTQGSSAGLSHLRHHWLHSWSFGPRLAAAAFAPGEQHQSGTARVEGIDSEHWDVTGQQAELDTRMLLDGASSTGSSQGMQAGGTLLPGAGSAPSTWGSDLVGGGSYHDPEEQWEQNTRGRMLAINPNSK
jgi:hypothetical protein